MTNHRPLRQQRKTWYLIWNKFCIFFFRWRCWKDLKKDVYSMKKGKKGFKWWLALVACKQSFRILKMLFVFPFFALKSKSKHKFHFQWLKKGRKKIDLLSLIDSHLVVFDIQYWMPFRIKSNENLYFVSGNN